MYRYEQIIVKVRKWIASGILEPGERLPSVREMSRQSGVSAVTVQNAYAMLESEGVIVARPRSGYYLADIPRSEAAFPSAADGVEISGDRSQSHLRRLYALKRTWRETGLDSFGHMHLSDDLLPRKEMVTHLLRVLRDLNRRPSSVGPVEGELALREIIAKAAARRGQFVRADEIMVTSSAQSALNLCLDTVTKPGDSVIVETPGYFPFFGALKRRGLNVIEIYSHPQNGMDPSQLQYLLDNNDVSALIVMPTHHFPTGITYSDDVLARVVHLCGAKKVPIVEYDIYGELGYGVVQETSMKRFDDNDIVLQIGSFAETLGPQYGLGWIVNGRYRNELNEQFFLDETANVDAAIQATLLDYLHRRSYDRHLRTLRETLGKRMRTGIEILHGSAPPRCVISQPTGGFMCWIRVSSEFNALEAAYQAVGEEISMPPGPLFSVTGSFKNFIGLNLSFPWDSDRRRRLETLAMLLRAFP